MAIHHGGPFKKKKSYIKKEKKKKSGVGLGSGRMSAGRVQEREGK